MKKHKLVLASKSPRRKQLLAEAGFEFDVKTKEVDESYPPELDVYKVAEYIALKKAAACQEFLVEDTIALAADTTVIQGDQLFGKPKDRDDAIRILKLLSGTTHDVVTGVCLFTADKQESFSRTSTVHLDPMTLEEIEFYVDTYEPYDKAGAYGVQEWIGHCKISKIEGTYTNIMGLPVEGVYKALQNWD